jgi:hypothetical protein
MTRFTKLTAGVLTLTLAVSSAWGQVYSTVALAATFGQEAKKKVKKPKPYAGHYTAAAVQPENVPHDCFDLGFCNPYVQVCPPAPEDNSRPRTCQPCVEEGPAWAPVLAADCVKLWRFLWDLGCYREAEDMAREACQLDAASIEARHALVVSQVVNAMFGAVNGSQETVVIGPPSPCNTTASVPCWRASRVTACAQETADDGCEAAACATAACATAACVKGACKPAAVASKTAACACGDKCACAKKACACGAQCACAKNGCACGDVCGCKPATKRKFREIRREVPHSVIFVPGPGMPPPVPPAPCLAPCVPGVSGVPVPPAAVNLPAMPPGVMHLPRPAIMPMPYAAPPTTYVQVPFHHLLPDGSPCCPFAPVQPPAVVGMAPAVPPCPADVLAARPTRYARQVNSTCTCVIPGFIEVSCERMSRIEGNRIVFEGDVTMMVHMEQHPAKITADRIVVDVRNRTYEVSSGDGQSTSNTCPSSFRPMGH